MTEEQIKAVNEISEWLEHVGLETDISSIALGIVLHLDNPKSFDELKDKISRFQNIRKTIDVE